MAGSISLPKRMELQLVCLHLEALWVEISSNGGDGSRVLASAGLVVPTLLRHLLVKPPLLRLRHLPAVVYVHQGKFVVPLELAVLVN